MTVSTPLPGDSKPNVRMTVFPSKPNFALAYRDSRNGKSGIPWGMMSIL